jgi:SAM-dependent methyltransferase
MTEAISREKARKFYDRIGRAQDARPINERRALDAIVEQGDFPHAQAVVEFGCGTGRFAARLLRERLPGDATYLGVDLSPRMVALAHTSLVPWQDRARAQLSNGRITLPVPAGGADRVVSTYVLDLLSPCDTAEFVAEARRALRPGGVLALASLTPGRTLPARLVTRLWRAVWGLDPALLGGCRPIVLDGILSPDDWTVVAHFPVTDCLLSSDVLVARRR